MQTKLILWLCLLALAGSAAAQESTWRFDEWDGPALEVRQYVPPQANAETPIVVVMHGWSRDAQRYFSDWRTQGELHGFIVVVPHFPVAEFPTSTHYNLGHVFDRESGQPRPTEAWTFTAIERIFDAVVQRVDGAQTTYTLYGHSAGAQFVHRFAYYMPDARVRRYLAANAGWYTMADFLTDYPYGLKDAAISEDQLRMAMGKELIILLGREDIDSTNPNLRNSPQAKRQGKNRFGRGLTFFQVAKVNAEQLGVDLKWKLAVVEGAGHVNAQMTPVAAGYVE